MRILWLSTIAYAFAGLAAPQPASPATNPQERPTLNRPASAPPSPAAAPSETPPAAPTPSASASPTPEAGPAQPGAPVENSQPDYPDLLPRFDYDSKSGLDLRETNVEMRGNVRLIELSYSGSGGDRVPAYLVIPHGNGPFAGVIWGHWLKRGSPLANKDEFLDEALVLAHAGVVSLLIDAPQARHGYVEEKDLLESVKQQSEASMHQVIDLRRAVDLLLIRRDVDRKRIAYVGHSWSAHVGAILAGVDNRICCFILMASGYADEDDTFSSRDPLVLGYRQQLGDDTLREYFHEYAYDDPVHFVGHTDRESIFLQFAAGDSAPSPAPATNHPSASPGAAHRQSGKTAARPDATTAHPDNALDQKYLDSFSSKDKQMQIYDAGHALNATARLDRYRWLQKHLGLKKLDEKELEGIEQLK